MARIDFENLTNRLFGNIASKASELSGGSKPLYDRLNQSPNSTTKPSSGGTDMQWLPDYGYGVKDGKGFTEVEKYKPLEGITDESYKDMFNIFNYLDSKNSDERASDAMKAYAPAKDPWIDVDNPLMGIDTDTGTRNLMDSLGLSGTDDNGNVTRSWDGLGDMSVGDLRNRVQETLSRDEAGQLSRTGLSRDEYDQRGYAYSPSTGTMIGNRSIIDSHPGGQIVEDNGRYYYSFDLPKDAINDDGTVNIGDLGRTGNAKYMINGEETEDEGLGMADQWSRDNGFQDYADLQVNGDRDAWGNFLDYANGNGIELAFLNDFGDDYDTRRQNYLDYIRPDGATRVKSFDAYDDRDFTNLGMYQGEGGQANQSDLTGMLRRMGERGDYYLPEGNVYDILAAAADQGSLTNDEISEYGTLLANKGVATDENGAYVQGSYLPMYLYASLWDKANEMGIANNMGFNDEWLTNRQLDRLGSNVRFDYNGDRGDASDEFEGYDPSERYGFYLSQANLGTNLTNYEPEETNPYALGDIAKSTNKNARWYTNG